MMATHFQLLVLAFAIVPLLIVTVHLHHGVVMDDRDPSTGRARVSPTSRFLQESKATLQWQLSSLKHLVSIPVNRSQTNSSDTNASPNRSSPNKSARHRGPTIRYEHCRQTVRSLKTGTIRPIHQGFVDEQWVKQDRVNAGEATGTNTTEDYHQYHTCRYGNETIRMPQAPTLMILGAQKAGTTSLYHYLRQHPDITSSIQQEPHFLTSKIGQLRRYAQVE
jgi:hypothetical protein